jgi:aminoglycoside phosphotransferase
MRLAPDPAVPHRDALLDERVVAHRLGVERCLPVYAKYRVGESLRVVHEIAVDGAPCLVASRTFPEGRTARVYERALAAATDGGLLRAVAHDPELGTVFWTFPNDRRIHDLSLLREPQALGRLLGRPRADARLVAYVPETSATARCLDDGGRTVAYAKVYAGDGAERARRLRDALPDSVQGRSCELRLPRLMASSPARRTLLLEPLDGPTPLDPRAGPAARSVRRLGAALATLHELPAPTQAPRFDRLDSGGLITAAGLIALVRPDKAETAERLAEALDARRPPAEQPACLHGDPHLRNALVHREAIVLVDLDHVCVGPRAADLARVLATLAHLAAVGDLPLREELRLGDELLTGYADEGTVPEAGTLRWHVAATLLVRHAAKSVSRFRPRALARIEAVLGRAEELIS